MFQMNEIFQVVHVYLPHQGQQGASGKGSWESLRSCVLMC